MKLPSAILLLIFSALISALPHKYNDGKKNIIFMVSDGLGISGITAARQYKQTSGNLTNSEAVLDIENYLIGSVRTKSSSQLVTDSAAAGTAFAAGVKSYNGAISVDPHGKPVGTFYEGAKLLNYSTGIVSTTFVQDATICTPNTHVLTRKSVDLIATQQLGYDHPLGQVIDVILGGGRQYLHGVNQTQYGTKGKRSDGIDYIAKAQEDGWTYLNNKTDFNELAQSGEVKLPLLGLFDTGSLPYNIDTNLTEIPSLAEMSLLAIDQLVKATENTEQGFVLLLEGARIDHGGHANDPVALATDTLAYSDAWKAVIDRVSTLDTETLVVSTSDHETGGFALAQNDVYDYYPDVLVKTPHSVEYALKVYAKYNGTDNANYLRSEILEGVLNMNTSNITETDLVSMVKSDDLSTDIVGILSDQAGVAWTTMGHSAQDVPLYAYSNTKEGYNRILSALGSSIENTEIPAFFAEELGVDLEEVTELIQDIAVKPATKA
ncbi:hypothetical protein WICPIJ_006886 [Wickerhamomyces pijperi]|uniref:Alkaline phosphatase n=1 Tax=Wickerhamomyces pijperi TaxID=599730 RepID=A0A9P8Q2Z8_WICPI|nr:hypothetical protein WICPIJ_006886 [Wickerhamomyces pijperi]